MDSNILAKLNLMRASLPARSSIAANGTLLPVTPPLGGVVRGLGTAAGPEGRLLTGGFTETMPCGGVFRTMVVGGEGVKTGCIQGVWGA